MSQQTKLTSLIEVCVNTAIGFVVSALAWPIAAWWLDYPYSVSHTLQVTTFYTILSIARSYVVRRFFARGLHITATRIAQGWVNAKRAG